MRLLVLCSDLPVPPNHGDRVEMLNGLRALHAAGVTLRLYISTQDLPTEDDLRQLTALAERVEIAPRNRRLDALLRHPLLPFQASTRLGGSADEAVLSELGEGCDAVLVHHDCLVPLGRTAARAAKIPLVLRSHNVEAAYIRELARAADRPLQRLMYALESLRVSRLERAVLRDPEVVGVAAITARDADQIRRYRHDVEVVPAFMLDVDEHVEPPSADMIRGRHSRQNVLFIGGLFMPNTAEGIAWFAEQSWPAVRAALPDATLTIAGRRPSAAFARRMAQLDGVTLVADPVSLESLYREATCFVNPVRFGAGINMKLGAPLARGLPVIATPLGARGIDSADGAVRLAVSPEDLGLAVRDLLSDDVQYRTAVAAAVSFAAEHLAPAVSVERLLALLRRSRPGVAALA